MSGTTTNLKGVVRGRTIELEEETHLPDGQAVEVTLLPIATAPHIPGDGIRASAGGWSDDPEGVDEFVKWTYEQRRLACADEAEEWDKFDKWYRQERHRGYPPLNDERE